MSNIESLKKLREPFKANQISKLPKPTKAQTEAVRDDYKKGIRCKDCGAWHHPDVVHLDYCGHAALTDRLLDVDPLWTWEPVSLDSNGNPFIDKDGGMWIKLTVCGVTRLGYGDAQGKTGGDAMKERIGDALRNAAMRYGAALDLWHKGDLHIEEPPEKPEAKKDTKPAEKKAYPQPTQADYAKSLADAKTMDELVKAWGKIPKEMHPLLVQVKDELKAKLSKPDWPQMLKDSKSAEEASAIYNSIPDAEKVKFNDIYDEILDGFRIT